MPKTKILKTVTAGRLVYGVCYTQSHPRDPERVRAAKVKCSSEARKRLNFRMAWQKLELLLAANFGLLDLVLTLTYDDAHLPPDRRAAVALVKKFLAQLRQYRAAREQTLRYIYVTESRHGDARVHHHLVINGTGADIEVIRSLWPHGENVEFDPVDIWGYEGLAKYLTKEPREEGAPPNAKSWTPSLGLNKPVTRSAWVEENVTLEAPPGAVILDSDSKRNEYGVFLYIKYLLPRPPDISQRTRPRKLNKASPTFSDLEHCICPAGPPNKC